MQSTLGRLGGGAWRRGIWFARRRSSPPSLRQRWAGIARRASSATSSSSASSLRRRAHRCACSRSGRTRGARSTTGSTASSRAIALATGLLRRRRARAAAARWSRAALSQMPRCSSHAVHGQVGARPGVAAGVDASPAQRASRPSQNLLGDDGGAAAAVARPSAVSAAGVEYGTGGLWLPPMMPMSPPPAKASPPKARAPRPRVPSTSPPRCSRRRSSRGRRRTRRLPPPSPAPPLLRACARGRATEDAFKLRVYLANLPS